MIANYSVFSCGTVFLPMQCYCEIQGPTAADVFDKSNFSKVPFIISDPVVFIAQRWGRSKLSSGLWTKH